MNQEKIPFWKLLINKAFDLLDISKFSLDRRDYDNYSIHIVKYVDEIILNQV